MNRLILLRALLGIGTTCGFLARIIGLFKENGVPYDLNSLWGMGFGAADVRALATPLFTTSTGNKALVSTILTANFPQAIFSFLYLLYNSLFTCMLLGDEWDGFSHQRRPLRVTAPTGVQRSTHFLQLPYKYSIPLMIASGVMHWMVSQSIFLTRIAICRKDGIPTIDIVSLIGWSPIAIITGLALAILMLAVVIINGFRKYGGGIPLVANCSAAISAACHPDPHEPLPAILLVLWGVVKRDGNTGHCSFSGEEVGTPVSGQLYAGKTSGGGRTETDGEVMIRDYRWRQGW